MKNLACYITDYHEHFLERKRRDALMTVSNIQNNSAKLTASVVGGGMGGRLSLVALAASDLFNLMAVADLREDVRHQLSIDFPGIRTFDSHQAMFAELPTDVVCVSTYAPSHEEITASALELPLKGILVEKPLGHTAASGRRLVDAVKARKLPMAVPHGMLAKRTPMEIIERTQAGEIGDLRLVEIECAGWDIINAGIHWLDFCVTLTNCNPIDSVMALCDTSTRTYRDGMQVETEAVTFVQTHGGVRFVMHTGDHVRISRPGHDFLFRLIGTAGQIEFWGWENGYILQNAKHPGGEIITPIEYPITGHRRHLERMASMIGADMPDYTIADASLMALEICEAAYLSSKHRCRIDFPFGDITPPTDSVWDPGQPYSGSGGGRDGRNL